MQDELLPEFEPSEADLIQMALDMPFERKIEKALLFFQTYCDGCDGGFSGGKDSVAIWGLAKEAGVSVNWSYSNTTIDPPELVQFIRKFHADIPWKNPRIGLLKRMIEKKSIPTRQGRWCCAEYKETGGMGKNVVVGVRIAESANRRKLWKQIVKHTKQNKTMIAPICYWTDEDVWQYIRSRNLPYCELYDQGFKRLGCVGCPKVSNKQREKEFARWPRFKQAWRRSIDTVHDNAVLSNNAAILKYGNKDGLWSWWMENVSRNNGQCVFEEMMEQT